MRGVVGLCKYYITWLTTHVHTTHTTSGSVQRLHYMAHHTHTHHSHHQWECARTNYMAHHTRTHHSHHQWDCARATLHGSPHTYTPLTPPVGLCKGYIAWLTTHVHTTHTTSGSVHGLHCMAHHTRTHHSHHQWECAKAPLHGSPHTYTPLTLSVGVCMGYIARLTTHVHTTHTTSGIVQGLHCMAHHTHTHHAHHQWDCAWATLHGSPHTYTPLTPPVGLCKDYIAWLTTHIHTTHTTSGSVQGLHCMAHHTHTHHAHHHHIHITYTTRTPPHTHSPSPTHTTTHTPLTLPPHHTPITPPPHTPLTPPLIQIQREI